MELAGAGWWLIPLKKRCSISELGWLETQYMEKMENVPKHQPGRGLNWFDQLGTTTWGTSTRLRRHSQDNWGLVGSYLSNIRASTNTSLVEDGKIVGAVPCLSALFCTASLSISLCLSLSVSLSLPWPVSLFSGMHAQPWKFLPAHKSPMSSCLPQAIMAITVNALKTGILTFQWLECFGMSNLDFQGQPWIIIKHDTAHKVNVSMIYLFSVVSVNLQVYRVTEIAKSWCGRCWGRSQHCLECNVTKVAQLFTQESLPVIDRKL